MRRTLVLPSVLAAAAAFATIAVANTTTVTDPKGDVRCTDESNHVTKCPPSSSNMHAPPDLRSASAGHAGGKLKHVVRGWTRLYAKDIKSFGAVGLEIHAGGHAYFTIGNGGSSEMHQSPSGKVSGSVTVTQVDSHTVKFVFAKSAIGSPAKYTWRAQDNAACEKCTPSDRVPNTGFVTHKLR
jgi:hypothetical protein